MRGRRGWIGTELTTFGFALSSVDRAGPGNVDTAVVRRHKIEGRENGQRSNQDPWDQVGRFLESLALGCAQLNEFWNREFGVREVDSCRGWS